MPLNLAFHRSITFWSGFLTMGFICWAWWNSLMYSTTLHHRFDRGAIWTSNVSGGVALKCYENGFYDTPYTQTYLTSLNIAKEFFPAPFYIRGGRSDSDPPFDPLYRIRPRSYEDCQRYDARHYPPIWRVIFIPHWLILGASAAMWIALLLWRASWRKRTVGGA